MRVWLLSFQKLAMCVQEASSITVFASEAPMRTVGEAREGTRRSVVDVKKLAINFDTLNIS